MNPPREEFGATILLAALRAALREKGLARAAQFTWRKCAEEHLAVFEEALRGDKAI